MTCKVLRRASREGVRWGENWKKGKGIEGAEGLLRYGRFGRIIIGLWCERCGSFGRPFGRDDKDLGWGKTSWHWDNRRMTVWILHGVGYLALGMGWEGYLETLMGRDGVPW